MTTGSDETTVRSSHAASQSHGALLAGVFGAISAGIGMLCFGMAGLVWRAPR
ncbi:hypothetical protein [Microbacterium sp.]|uniref:hypothetical protein n=1 Tax=Microbacterium sp. TaxID=51671 RepID=UPI002811CCE1|nr:hypothetical protein [Microbacterium sp.]